MPYTHFVRATSNINISFPNNNNELVSHSLNPRQATALARSFREYNWSALATTLAPNSAPDAPMVVSHVADCSQLFLY